MKRKVRKAVWNASLFDNMHSMASGFVTTSPQESSHGEAGQKSMSHRGIIRFQSQLPPTEVSWLHTSCVPSRPFHPQSSRVSSIGMRVLQLFACLDIPLLINSLATKRDMYKPTLSSPLP